MTNPSMFRVDKQ